ncbi:MAG: O-antigen ligase family protein [Bacteroidota bacterium]
MNLLVLILFFIIAAIFHQALYVLIPITSVGYLLIRKTPKLTLDPVVKLYFKVVVVATLFFLLQSLMNSDIAIYSIKGIARYVSYFLFAVLVLSLDTVQIKNFFKIVITFFAITLPLGFYQVWALGRYQSFFNHANPFAYVLCICIYFLIFHNPFNRLTRNGLLFLLFFSLVLTKSSGAMLVLLALLGFELFKSKRISLVQKLLFVFGFLVICVVVLLSSEKITSQLDSINYLNWDFLKDRVEQFKTGGYGSFIWRVIYWIKILFSFYEESVGKILFGVGVDTMTEGNMPYPYMYKDPHNDFLKVLVEFGVIGVLLFLWFFKKIYELTNKNFKIIILVIVPIFFGNTIVNFPFNLTLLLLLAYEYKQHYIKGS